jgi:cold shock CspA family protein
MTRGTGTTTRGIHAATVTAEGRDELADSLLRHRANKFAPRGTVAAMSNTKNRAKAIARDARLPVGHTRKEVTGTPSRGRISMIARGAGHGYIRTSAGQVVFFHKADTEEDLFPQLDLDADVTFELIEDQVSGPLAIRVRLPRRTNGVIQ